MKIEMETIDIWLEVEAEIKEWRVQKAPPYPEAFISRDATFDFSTDPNPTVAMHRVKVDDAEKNIALIALQTVLEKRNFRFQPIGEIFVQACEHAFLAGYKDCSNDNAIAYDAGLAQGGWDEYDPPEEFKGL